MKKMYVKKGFIITFLTILCIGVTFGITKKSNINCLNDETTIIQKGMNIRMLSTNNNSYGEKDMVFSYSFTPFNASNQGINTSIQYIDNTDCSSVMTYSIDEANHQITLTCKKAFNKQIHFVLTSKANVKATATVVLDYVKKIKSLSIEQDQFAAMNDYDEWTNTSYHRIKDFSPNNFYNVEYTESTKTNESFGLKLYYQTFKLMENTTQLSKSFTDNFTEALRLILPKLTITHCDLINSTTIWQMASSNADKSVLKAITKKDVNENQGYLKYSIGATVQTAKGESSAKGTISLTYFMYGNYTGEVGVDSLESEVNTIDF